MGFQNLITGLRHPSLRNDSAAALGLHSAQEFRRSVERERMRSDRSGLPFTLLALSLAKNDRPADRLERFVSICRQCLRTTDEMGFLDSQCIGIILPDTSSEGASKVAQKITKEFESRGGSVEWRVYVYPTDPMPDGKQQSVGSVESENEHDDSDGATVAAGSAQALNTLFTKRLPVWKRALDIVGAAVGLLLFGPVIFAAGMLIKITSPGPMFFAQRRTGIGGKPFTLYKLRTMRVDAEAQKAALRAQSEQDGPAFKMTNDPRITPVGHFLRRTAIDELPQFWNVLLGDMSLVGPRPLPCDEAAGCTGWQQRRIEVTPGLTCIWQVDGGRRVTFAEWMRMDIRYIRRRSLWQDFKLLVKTAVAVMNRRASV